MQNIMTIYRRESAAYFNSPIAYIFILAFLAIMAFFFFIFGRFFSRPNPDLRSYFELFPIIFIIFIPALTMRLWSEEKRQGTIELLMTFPVSTWEVVLAKFLASYTIVGIMIALTVFVPITVSFALNIDGSALVANYVGAFLIAGVYIAVGACLSALTENQVVAWVIAVLVCALLCFMGWPNVIDWINKNLFDGLGRFVGYFGTFFHYQKFAQGQISMLDVVYSLSMIGLFLGLNNFAVESRKY